jgi:hypothetical protein
MVVPPPACCKAGIRYAPPGLLSRRHCYSMNNPSSRLLSYTRGDCPSLPTALLCRSLPLAILVLPSTCKSRDIILRSGVNRTKSKEDLKSRKSTYCSIVICDVSAVNVVGQLFHPTNRHLEIKVVVLVPLACAFVIILPGQSHDRNFVDKCIVGLL